MKIIYLTDTQIRGINSENRIGDYYSDIMNKIKEVNSIAKKMKADIVIHGGDLFDSAIVSNTIVDDLIDEIEKNRILWYVVRGNHDEQNNSPKLSKASSLDHCFRRSNFINHLCRLENKNLIIKGYDYYTGIEQDIKEQGLMTDSKAKLKIAVVHALITEKSLLPIVMHIPFKDIKTNYDIILIGHNHKGWNQKIIEGVRWINPSCIGRLDIDEVDIKPKVVFIDTENEIIKFIELKNVKSKEEIFNLKKVEEKQDFENRINDFLESLKTIKFTDLDLQGIVMEIGKKNNYSKEVIDELLNRINNFKGE